MLKFVFLIAYLFSFCSDIIAQDEMHLLASKKCGEKNRSFQISLFFCFSLETKKTKKTKKTKDWSHATTKQQQHEQPVSCSKEARKEARKEGGNQKRSKIIERSLRWHDRTWDPPKNMPWFECGGRRNGHSVQEISPGSVHQHLRLCRGKVWYDPAQLGSIEKKLRPNWLLSAKKSKEWKSSFNSEKAFPLECLNSALLATLASIKTKVFFLWENFLTFFSFCWLFFFFSPFTLY